MARKNARTKRKNERKVNHQTFDEALDELRRLRLQNFRSGTPERNRGLKIYPARGGYRIGHEPERTKRRKVWQYFTSGQRSL